MTRPHSLLPVLSALGLAAAPLAAPEAAAAPIDLGEIVVSANVEPTAANRVGATVDVVTGDDLKSAAQGSAGQALALVPGLTIQTKGGVGSQTSFSIRGAGQNYVGVLVDGIDVTDPSGTQTAFDFGHLGTGGIARIEVLKGSQSALYGSSAVGGVIDIASRHATEEGLHHYLDGEVGSDRTANASYGFTAKTAQSDFALTLSHTGTSGFASYVGAFANGNRDGYWANRAAANGSHTLANGVKIGFAGFVEQSHGDYFPVGSVVFSATPAALSPLALGQQTARTHGLRVYTEVETGAVTHRLSATTFRIARHYVEGPTAIATDTRYVGTRTKLAYQGAVGLGTRARLAFGADSSREGLDQSGSYGAVTGRRTITGLFAELAYSPSEAVDLTAAVRRDHDSRFGGATTGRLALAWRPGDALTVRASAGTGFRAPSTYELFSLYGNAGLQPEKSRSLDLGVEKRFGGSGVVRVTAFWLSADNLIGYDPASTACSSGFGCYAQVPGTSRRTGVEIEGETLIAGRVTVKGSYTYTDSAVNAANWASVPRHAGALTVSAPLTRALTGALTVQGAADRVGLPNYVVANADFTYDLGNRAEAYLRVENLFDAKYQLVKDYATPGRSLFVGFRKSF